LLSILATLLTPDRGRVTILGHDVVREAGALRRRLNMVSGRPSFLWSLRVGEIVAFYGRLYGLSGRRLRQRVDSLIELCELTPYRRVPYSDLSTGLKQRSRSPRRWSTSRSSSSSTSPRSVSIPTSPCACAAIARPAASRDHDRADDALHARADEPATRSPSSRPGASWRAAPGRAEAPDPPRRGHRAQARSAARAVAGRGPGCLRCVEVDGWVECTVDEAEKRLPEILPALHAEGVVIKNVQVREPELEEVFVELAK
jgi:ABC-2 type transport system ATP-binding protein